MPLIAKGDHDGAATVDELLHDLVEDMIQALPTGEGATTVFRRPTAFCRPTGRLRRPHRVRREGSPRTASVAAKSPPIREVVPLTDAPETSEPSRAGGDEDPRRPH